MAQASQMLAWVSWGLENARKRPFCPSSLVSFVFRIETPSGSSLCTVTGVQCRKLTSKNQKINEHWSPDEIRVWQTSMSLVFYIYQDFNVFILLQLPRLQCLQSFTFTRLQCLQSFIFFETSMSLVFTFTRLQCLQFFTFTKTSMSSVFYIFQGFNVFSLLHLQRLQCLQAFTFLQGLQCLQFCCTRLQRLLLNTFDTSMSISILFFYRFHFLGFLWCPVK